MAGDSHDASPLAEVVNFINIRDMNSAPRLHTTLARLIAVQVCIHACMTGIRMAAPLLVLRQGYSPAMVGILLSLFSLSLVFIALPAGRYADQHSLKRPVAVSVALTVLGAGLAVLWPIFPVLCLSAFLTGGATGSALISLQRHVGRMASNKTEIRQVFSWLAIGPSISNFLGPFAAGLMIDHAGFRAAFALMAILPVVSWLLVRGTPELPLPEKPAEETPLRFWDLLAEPQMRRLLLINWVLSSCWDVHTFVLPVLGHERGFSASVIGMILGFFAIAATLVRVAIPIIAARLQEWRVIFSAMISTALLFSIYPLMQSPWTMGFCSILLGFSLGSVQPMIMSTLHQITPPHRHGEALGLRMMSINASSTVMPMMFGTAGAIVGVSGLFWVVGVFVASGSWFAKGLSHRA